MEAFDISMLEAIMGSFVAYCGWSMRQSKIDAAKRSEKNTELAVALGKEVARLDERLNNQIENHQRLEEGIGELKEDMKFVREAVIRLEKSNGSKARTRGSAKSSRA